MTGARRAANEERCRLVTGSVSPGRVSQGRHHTQATHKRAEVTDRRMLRAGLNMNKENSVFSMLYLVCVCVRACVQVIPGPDMSLLKQRLDFDILYCGSFYFIGVLLKPFWSKIKQLQNVQAVNIHLIFKVKVC